MKALAKNTLIFFLFTISFLASSLAMAQTKVYRTDANANSPPALQVYDVNTDSWSILATLPAINTTQLATSDTDLFALPEDGNIYVYNSGNNSWDFLMAGPAAAVGRQTISMFETYNDEFYWANDGTSTLYYTDGGVWTSVQTPSPVSSGADFDRVLGYLYIRTYSQLGHMSFDPATNSFGPGCSDSTSVGENSRVGSFYGGDFYTRTWSGNLVATNVSTCVKTDTGVALTTEHAATAVDDDGNIYLNGYSNSENTFEVQDLGAGTVTPLADSPGIGGSNVHSTLAIIRDGTTGGGQIDAVPALPVPSLNQWAMTLLIVLLGGFAGWRLNRRYPV